MGKTTCLKARANGPCLWIEKRSLIGFEGGWDSKFTAKSAKNAKKKLSLSELGGLRGSKGF